LTTGYRRTVLDDGLRVVSEQMPNVKSLAVGIWIDVGSRNETAGENGCSHFIEHMCFKGTRRRTAREIAQSLEFLGGTLNAFTTRENTCYYARVLDEHFEIGFDVLADITTQSLFDRYEFEKEKDVICEEIKDVYDTPSDIVHDYFAEAIWDSHPLGQPIMGEAKGIRGMQRRDLVGFARRHYTTDKIVLAAAGAVEHDRLVELAGKQLLFPRPPAKSKLIKPPSYRQGIKLVKKRKLTQTHVCIGFPSIDFAHPRKYHVLLLNTLLGAGMGSRLFQTVREDRGLAYTIYSYQDFYHDTGIFGLYLGTDIKKTAEAVNLVLTELATVKENSVTEEEVASAKSQLKGSLILSLEGSYNRMNRLGRFELFNQPFTPLEQSAAEIDAVTLNDVREVAREILQEKYLTMVVLGPVEKKMLKTIDWSILQG
jgi:predicted Zn-dependent peptidase